MYCAPLTVAEVKLRPLPILPEVTKRHLSLDVIDYLTVVAACISDNLRLSEAAAYAHEFCLHPILTALARIACEQQVAPLPFHLRPYSLYGVEDRTSRWQEQELALLFLSKLSHLAAPMRSMIVKHDCLTADVVECCEAIHELQY